MAGETTTTTTNVSNVSVGKPKITGAIYMAPAGTALPTDAVTPLAAAYVGLGYVSEDGVSNANTAETSETKAWGGDVVSSEQTSKPDKFKYKLIEAMNVNVLKAAYGDGNVSGSLEQGITVRANSMPSTTHVWVIDMILKNNAVKRIVIPEGKVTEVDEINYKDDEVIGYALTLAAQPSVAIEGDTHREYMKSAAAAS